MIKNKEKDYCNQIYYQSFNSHHEFLSASLCISLLCILISILLFSHISTQEDKSSFFCKEPNILVSFAQYITDTFNPAMGILGSLIVSALIFMSKGSNKYLFLQWRTIYNAVPWKIWLYCIQFIVSFIFQVHASKYEQYIIAACSAFSILMLIFCFIWYVIRYNNERQYFVNEQCLVLLKTFSKPSKFKNYLSLLFPNSPEKYNDMDDNINILKSLILHTDISLNLESSQNQTYCFFKHLVIPYIVFMKKTFLADKEKLIISLQKALSYDLNSNPDVNQALRYLLLVITRQYLIEVFSPTNNTSTSETENIKYLTNWINEEEQTYFDAYGFPFWLTIEDPNQSLFSNQIEPEQQSNIKKNYWDIIIYDNFYSLLIDSLDEHNLIEKRIFQQKELTYMSYHKLLTYDKNHDKYSPHEVVLPNTIFSSIFN